MNNWKQLPFDQVAVAQPDKGRRIKQRDYLPAGDIPVIDQGQEPIGGYTNDAALAFDGELPVVLFGDHTRAVKLVSQRFAVGADGIKIFKPADGVRPKYLYYWMKNAPIPDRGYGRHYQYLRKLIVPVPSPAAQDNIVAEIEKQFSRLDEAAAGLKRVKANLKRYKAAILKAVVEGRLFPDSICSEAFQRPNWKPIGAVIDSLVQGWSPQCDSESTQLDHEWAVIKTTAVQALSFVSSENKRLPSELAPREQLSIEAGDLLITRAGPRSRVGVACLSKTSHSHLMICDKVYRLRVKGGAVSPEFAELSLNAPSIVDALDELKTGISDSGLNLTQKRFMELEIPLPPIAEQHRIVAEVDRLLSIAREAEAEVETNLKRAQGLRQAILSKAFMGDVQ